MAHTRIGEKGQLTIPKQYRDEFGLETGLRPRFFGLAVA
jgi:AbrB family looped-hinge helix DNA binding protein